MKVILPELTSEEPAEVTGDPRKWNSGVYANRHGTPQISVWGGKVRWISSGRCLNAFDSKNLRKRYHRVPGYTGQVESVTMQKETNHNRKKVTA